MLASLALNSLNSRRRSVLLTFFSLLISIAVLISVEHIRVQAKESFNRTISGVDLIVGAPSGQLNLLLYSVFRMGNPTNNIKFDSFQALRDHKQVNWAIPISLGDSHRGYRVLGTDDSYFAHYKFGKKQSLQFSEGQPFHALFDVVLGADVAKQLNYQIGDKIVIAHGIGATSFSKHDKTPFAISGILKPTGTPVDKTVHVSLKAIEAIHLSPAKQARLQSGDASVDLMPKSVTSVLVGLNSKLATFKLQRELGHYQSDRLMAILPGVAMTELWQMMASIENILRVISVLVLISALFGLSTMLLASMEQRKSEFAVLRVLGASAGVIFTLILTEAFILMTFAFISAAGFVFLVTALLSDWLAANYGLFISQSLVTWDLIVMFGLVAIATFITSLIPALDAYKRAIHSTLSAK